MELAGSRGSLIVATHVGPMFRETNDKAHIAAAEQCKTASRSKRVHCLLGFGAVYFPKRRSLYYHYFHSYCCENHTYRTSHSEEGLSKIVAKMN